MKKTNRILAIVLTLVLTIGMFSVSTSAANSAPTREEKAQVLYALGLFKGYDDSGSNFGLNDRATREQALVILIRMLGQEKAALAWTGTQPYTDVPANSWARPYIGYAKQEGLTVGVGNNKFGMGVYARMDEMATFALRGLGYNDLTKPADFTVSGSVAFAKSIGMLDSDKVVTPFTRGEAVDIVFGSIGTTVKGQDYDLLSKLINNGTVTQAQYDKALAIVGEITTAMPTSNLPDGTYTMTCLGKYFRVNAGKLEIRNTTPAQSFTVINKSGGYAYIQTSDGKYLSLGSTTQGTQVTTSSTAFPWLILKQSGSNYAIYPYNAPNQVVNANGEKSDNGTKIIIWPGSGWEKNALITMTAAGAKVDPTSVTLDKTSLTLAVGETYDLTAKLAPTNSKISLTWSSNSTGVATVGGSGFVTGVKAGTATITVKSYNGLTATCKVTVTDKYTDKKVNLYNSTKQDVTDIRISSTQNADWGGNLTSRTVKPDASVAILVPVSSTDYTYDILITYKDGSTATFAEYSFKRFTSGGSLYAYLDNGTPILSTTKPTAAKVAVTGIKLDQTSASLAVGEQGQITGTVSPSNATNQNVTWTSSAPTIATVDSYGVVTGVKAGTATITVKTVDGSKTATCKITVTAAATADTSAASKTLTDRYSKTVIRFNSTQTQLETLGLYTGELKATWDSYATQLNSTLSFIGTGTYTQDQITTANAVLDSVVTTLDEMDKAIAEAKAAAAKPAEPTSITAPITLVNNTGVDISAVYMTSQKATDWGSSLGTIANGTSGVTNVTFKSDALIWDLMIEDSQGTTIKFLDIDFAKCSTSGGTITLTISGGTPYVTTSW